MAAATPSATSLKSVGSSPGKRCAYEGARQTSQDQSEILMSIRFAVFAMVLNSAVSIVAWECGRPVPARAQTEHCDEPTGDFQDQDSKCLKEAARLVKDRDCWEM